MLLLIATFGLGLSGSVTSVYSRMILALVEDGGGKKNKTGTCCD